MSSGTASPDGRFDVLAEACPTRQLISRVGDRWSLLVLYALENQTLRFQQLRREVQGVSQKMLTQTLRVLERDGLVRRTVYASVPPKVEYALTPLGASLAEPVAAIRVWAYAHMDEIDQARHQFDQLTAPTPAQQAVPGRQGTRDDLEPGHLPIDLCESLL
jgi:DNA-binding HxlR family transcriptional regulator